MKLKNHSLILITLTLMPRFNFSETIDCFKEKLSQSVNTVENIISKNRKDETYTFGIFMAADNDLFPFAGRNIKQMQNVGSNDRLKIVIHFDMHRPGQNKVSKRLLIEKNKIIQIGPDQSMDSGDPNTLIDFCKFMIEKFPADNYVLDLWNHGMGIIEPILKKSINPSELFTYNPTTKLIELNRNISFFDYINISNLTKVKEKTKSICFDDTTGNYLTNKKLKEALKLVSTQFLKGKKLAILACDACLMAMIEVAAPLKDYVEYFVSSQEVELGTGYNYSTVFSPFKTKSLDKYEFACHLVSSYKDTYSKITNDYTHSAYDLSFADQMQNIIDKLAKELIIGLNNQKDRSVKETIRLSRHKNFCTYFDEQTYIDLGHFLVNLQKNINKFTLKTAEQTNEFKNNLNKIINESFDLIGKFVIANTVGKNLKNATGISIYLPEYHIHSSYFQSEFANNTSWLDFLKLYLKN